MGLENLYLYINNYIMRGTRLNLRSGFCRLIPAALLFLSSCASMSTMQTARTIAKGEVGFGFGGGMVKSELPLGDLDTISINAPFVEASARYGVTDNLDFGVKITIIGTACVDGKYQFMGTKESKLAGAVGIGVGYLSVTSGDWKSKIFDIMSPLYFSYHPATWLAVYCSPKYTLRLNSYSDNKNKGTSTSSWYGVTGGMRLGKRVAFLAEYSYFANSEISIPFSQITCGISVGIP